MVHPPSLEPVSIGVTPLVIPRMSIPWTAMERRWRDALLAAMIPDGPRLGGFASIDTSDFWLLYSQTAPPLVRFGLRASVWILTWMAMIRVGRPFHRLPPDEQDRFLRRTARSRLYLTRQLVTTVKLIACLAWFRDPKGRSLIDTGIAS